MKIQVSFQECSNESVQVAFVDDSDAVSVSFGTVDVITDATEIDRYTGEYEITPKIDAQLFPTAAKLMQRDMNVLAIPYVAVSNQAGGSTVTIGGQ